MKNGLLIYDSARAEINKDFIEHYIDIGDKYGFNIKLCIIDDPESENYSCRLDYLNSISHGPRPDFAIIRTQDYSLQRYFGERGIITHNNFDVAYYANHKGRCIDYISKNSEVSCPETLTIMRNSDMSFFNKYNSFVVKSASGHGGNEVFRFDKSAAIRNKQNDIGIDLFESADSDCIKEIIKYDDLVIQPYIEGPGSDVRVYVVFNKIVAAVKRTALEGEFRSNFSLGGIVEPYDLSDSETETVNKIIKLFDFSMAGIDFIIDKNGEFVFNEIEDVVGSRMLYKTHPDMDILDIFFRKLSE